jgi:hypothetical protein
MSVEFLRAGERLIRVHRFRFIGGRGCGLGTTEIVVEEDLGPVADAAARCQARPEHPTRVPRPDFIVTAETVEGAVQACIEKMRGRTPADLFFPQT